MVYQTLPLSRKFSLLIKTHCKHSVSVSPHKHCSCITSAFSSRKSITPDDWCNVLGPTATTRASGKSKERCLRGRGVITDILWIYLKGDLHAHHSQKEDSLVQPLPLFATNSVLIILVIQWFHIFLSIETTCCIDSHSLAFIFLTSLMPQCLSICKLY